MGDKSVPAKDRDWSGAIGQAARPLPEEAKKAIVPEELSALSTGIRKVGKDQKKFKVLKSPHSGSKIPMQIKVPKRK